MIARQRFSLNRTVRLVRRPADAPSPDPEVIQSLIDSEDYLAETTRLLAEFLEKKGNFRCEFLYDAETLMLAAKESLSESALPKAAEEEREALTCLIKARDKLKQALPKCSPASLAEIRKFDRTQAQKLRRPKDRDEEAEELANRLKQLAEKEEIVYATIAALIPPEDQPPRQQPPTKTNDQGANTPSQTPSEQQSPNSEPQESSQQPSQSLAQTKSAGQEDREGSEGTPDEMDGGQLEQIQSEIVHEAYDIERAMQRIDGLSELARTRMDGATKKAEQVSSALSRGNSPEATEASRQASAMFSELAEHVEGLLSREAAQRIAKARDMASQLARREQKLGDAAGSTPKSQGKSGAEQPNDSDQPGSSQQDGQQKGKGQEGEGQEGEGQSETGSGGGSRGGVNPDHELRDQAAGLAESGRTLEDVLRALAKESDEREPSGAGTAEKVARLMDELKVGDTVAQMQQLADQLKGGRHDQTRLEAEDISGQLEILAQRLEAVHRAVVTPRLHELIALEQRAAELREELKKLESEGDVSQWHRAADLLAQDLERLSTADRAATDLLEAMRDEGWGGDLDRWNWDRVDGGPYYVGPGSYDSHLGLIIGELQLEARELLLSDLIAAGDESTPPEYKLMVERYFKVLSQEPRNE